MIAMLIEKLKTDILMATRTRNALASALLKVVLGECQSKNKFDDDFIVSYCRKMIQSNLETIAHGGDQVKLTRENELLRMYLPPSLSEEELQIHADKLQIQILDTKSEGQAIGVLSKYLKSIGCNASGDLIKKVVSKIRAATHVS